MGKIADPAKIALLGIGDGKGVAEPE